MAFHNNILADVNSLIDEINVGATKSASVKKAEEEASGSGSAGKDPGGYKGKTTHPSGKADAGTQGASVGFRGKENTEDVKKDVPVSVEDAPVNKQDSDYDQIQVGTKKSPTGEDPSVENAYKGDKDDERDGERGGTAGPFNAEEVGEKYSSLAFPQLYKIACVKANGVLAKIANGEKTAASKSTKVASAPAAPAAQKTQEPASAEAAAAGYELAKLAAAFGTTPEDESVIKFAAAQRVVGGFIEEGFGDADAVGEYLYKVAHYQEQFKKKAEGEMPGMPPGGPGGAPPEMGGGMPGGGADPTGGEPGPGAEMPPDAGGGAPGDAGAPGGGGVPDDAINELANAFIDAGIPVEKLIAALQGAAGGGGAPGGDAGGMPGGAPPEAGGMPGGEEAKAAAARLPAEVRADLPGVLNLCKRAASHMRAGKFRMCRPANDKVAAERVGAANYLNYIREVFAV